MILVIYEVTLVIMKRALEVLYRLIVSACVTTLLCIGTLWGERNIYLQHCIGIRCVEILFRHTYNYIIEYCIILQVVIFSPLYALARIILEVGQDKRHWRNKFEMCQNSNRIRKNKCRQAARKGSKLQYMFYAKYHQIYYNNIVL